jgi:hypothetical protein
MDHLKIINNNKNKVVMHISSCTCLAVALPAATRTAANYSLLLG